MRMTLESVDNFIDEAKRYSDQTAYVKSIALSNIAIAELLRRLVEIQQNKGP